MRLVACIVVRLHSKRLPKKAFRTLTIGKETFSTIELLILRAKRSGSFDEIVLCTSTNPDDGPLKSVAEAHGIGYYAGSELDVSERLDSVARIYKCEAIARLTGDNPLVSFERINLMKGLLDCGYEYIRYDKVPVGFSPEVFKHSTLKRIRQVMDLEESEYMMLYLYSPKQNDCLLIRVDKDDLSHTSVTIDTEKDLQSVQHVLASLGNKIWLNNGYDQALINALPKNSFNQSYSIDLDSIVKYPANKLITFKDYLLDMEKRRELSDKLVLITK